MKIPTVQKPRLKLILILFTILLSSFYVYGQTINGRTFYKISNEPFPFVNVQLIDSKNGNILKTVQSDLDGNFKFESIAKGKYNIKTFEITYGDSIIPIIVNNDISLKIVMLKKNCIYNKSLNNKTCPICHKKDKAIPIIYGLIVDSKKKNTNYLIGGCQITDCDPNWFCKRDDTKY